MRSWWKYFINLDQKEIVLSYSIFKFKYVGVKLAEGWWIESRGFSPLKTLINIMWTNNIVQYKIYNTATFWW